MTNADSIFEDIISKMLLLEKNQISDEISREDYEEWDSMTHLILVSELEQAFNIILSDDDIEKIKTIRNIKDTLLSYGVVIK